MADMIELSAEVSTAVDRFAAEGDALAEKAAFEDAIYTYDKAWQLLPEPKTQWNAATWLLAAIGDAAFLGGFYKTAQEALDYVMHCPDAIGNAFLHLRRGQVLFENADLDAAADELMRAYALEGAELFATEDGKYLAFLAQRATLDAEPAPGKRGWRRR